MEELSHARGAKLRASHRRIGKSRTVIMIDCQQHVVFYKESRKAMVFTMPAWRRLQEERKKVGGIIVGTLFTRRHLLTWGLIA